MTETDLKDTTDADEIDAADDGSLTDEQLFNQLAGTSPEPEADDSDAADDDDGDEESSLSDQEDEDSAADDEDEQSSDADQDDEVADAGEADLAALQKQHDELEHKYSTDKGRMRKMSQRIKHLESELAAAQKSAGEEGDDTSQTADIKEALDEARENYPDVVGPLADAVESMKARFDTLDQREKQELSNKQDELDGYIAEQESLFLESHPDGFDVLKENFDVFKSWINDQKAYLREIHEANGDSIVDGTGAALLVTKFKQALLAAGQDDPPSDEVEQLERKRQSQLDGARATRSGTRRQKSGDTVPNTTDEEKLFEHFAKQKTA